MATEGRSRKLIIGLVVAASIIMGKLFYIQIIEDKYKINASNNSMVYDIIYPTRGIIYDRNGQIIVGNKVAYDILVTPKEVTPFDTLMLADALQKAGAKFELMIYPDGMHGYRGYQGDHFQNANREFWRHYLKGVQTTR